MPKVIAPQEDREFVIGGETFKYAILHWSTSTGLLDGADDVRPEQNGGFSWRADTEFAIKDMVTYLDPDEEAVKRWKALVARKTNPVTRTEIVDAYLYARTQALGLPTLPPSSRESSDGGGSTEQGSSGGSPSTGATSKT